MLIYDGQATKNLSLYPLAKPDTDSRNPLWDEFEPKFDHSQTLITLRKARYFKNEMKDDIISGYISNSLSIISIEDSGEEDVVEDLSLEQMKIGPSINNIPIEMCQRVFQHLRASLEECYEKDGRHLDNIVFKK